MTIDEILEKVPALRERGVRRVELDGDHVASVELYELSEREQTELLMGRLTNAERAIYEGLSQEERERALLRRHHDILYHSS